MLHDVLGLLRTPLFVLSETPVTILALLTAMAILVVARVAGGVIVRSIGRVFVARHVDKGVGFAITKIVRWLIMGLGVVVALSTIGMNLSAVVAVCAVLLVGIGFGLQKLAENFISGLLLLVERPVRIGDFIAVEDCKGTVETIGLRATRITTRDGITYLVPNSELITKGVTNYTTPSTRIRVWIEVGVAYSADLDIACDALLAAARAEPLVLRDPAPEVRHQGFGESSIDLALVVWIENADDDDEVMSQLRFAIGRELAARDIAIPFPQRDLHIVPDQVNAHREQRLGDRSRA